MAIAQMPPPGRKNSGSEGVAANERLTASVGVLLVAVLAVIGITILRIGPLISVHMFVGMLILGPIALKLGSTGYRFASYYFGRPAYRRKGPPVTPLRILAVPLVLTTVVVLVSGVVLLLDGPGSRGTWFPIHKVSFILWVGCAGVHVLAHSLRAYTGVRAEITPDGVRFREVKGRNRRLMAMFAALLAGTIIAIVSLPDFGAWSHGGWQNEHEHGSVRALVHRV